MDIIFIEYIETHEFGKVAHFIDEDGKHIYSKEIVTDDTVYYQELSSSEVEKIQDEINS